MSLPKGDRKPEAKRKYTWTSEYQLAKAKKVGSLVGQATGSKKIPRAVNRGLAAAYNTQLAIYRKDKSKFR